jgi:hypothetical protein
MVFSTAQRVLRDFYQSYFPTASPFELPDGVFNDVGDISQWRTLKSAHLSRRWAALVIIAMLLGGLLGIYWRHWISMLLRWIRTQRHAASD